VLFELCLLLTRHAIMQMSDRPASAVEEALVCPACRGRLEVGEELRCASCDARYRYVVAADGRRIPCFVGQRSSRGEEPVMHTHWALATSPDRGTLLSRVRRLIGAGYLPRRREWERKRQELLSIRGEGTRVLEVGAGGRRLTPRTVTTDIFPFANTDFVADAVSLPVSDGSFDCVWLECLLEHCPEPQRVVTEGWRVTASGGAVFVHVPWMLFYHDFPGDYWRFSLDAIRTLFPPEAVVEMGVVYGPACAIVSLIAECWARSFTHKDNLWPYGVLRSLGLLLLLPWKYLDAILVRTPAGQRLASTLYAIARKPPVPGDQR